MKYSITTNLSLRAMLAIAALVGVGCKHNIRLVVPGATPVTTEPQVCTPDAKCQPASEQDQANLNQSGTTIVELAKCPDGYATLYIEDAGSSSPRVMVLCAANANVGGGI